MSTFKSENKWKEYFLGKFPKSPEIAENSEMQTILPKFAGIPGAWGMPREVSSFSEVPEKTDQFDGRKLQKCKPEFLIKWKVSKLYRVFLPLYILNTCVERHR